MENSNRIKNMCVTQLTVEVEPRFREAVQHLIGMVPDDMAADRLVYGLVIDPYFDCMPRTLQQQLAATEHQAEPYLDAILEAEWRYGARCFVESFVDDLCVSEEASDDKTVGKTDCFTYVEHVERLSCIPMGWEGFLAGTLEDPRSLGLTLSPIGAEELMEFLNTPCFSLAM